MRVRALMRRYRQDCWDEGGSNRIALHVAGGALLGGLGGGGIGSAAAGAAGAGVASALAGKLNGLADQIGSATGSMTLGNVTSNVLAGLGGAVVGGGMGAFTAANADLYNRSTGNGDGKGGTGSQFLDFIGDQLASAGRGAQNLANQFAALVNANGPQGPYVSPDDLNGPGGNSKPPATGGSAVPVTVCVPPVCVVVPAVTPGAPGYGAGNTTLNSGNGDGAKGNVTAESGAKPDPNETRAGQGLANAGYDVSHQPTANSQGTPGVRTADLLVTGVGQVDVYTPVNINPNSIVRNIEAKFDQANGVIVQANLSEAEMASIAARTWGKPNGQDFNTIFFQNSSGQVFRFDRPTVGK